MAEQRTKNISWPIEVTTRTKGIDFPMPRELAEQLLKGITIEEGKDVTEYFDLMDWPVNSPADLTEQIKIASEGRQVPKNRVQPSVKGGEH